MTTLDVLKAYRSDTTNHELTILHDDGLYRHLRFRNPKQGMYWFDLITTPGRLTFDGDPGTWVFARLTDMFEFFRSPRGRINEGYWAEKIRAQDRNGTKVYDPDLFKQNVLETFWDHRDSFDNPAEVWRVIRDDVFEWTHWHDETEARNALASVDNHLDRTVANPPELFADAWEWELKDYSTQFRWALHAIVDGIARYDEAKKEAGADL